MNNLSLDKCYELLAEFNIPPHIIAHVEKVKRVAVIISKGLIAKGHKIDLELVIYSSILHDIDRILTAKNPETHGLLSFDILTEKGYSTVARVVKNHRLDALSGDIPIEDKIVSYADKIVKEDKIVGIDRRLELFMQTGCDQFLKIIEENKKYFYEFEEYLKSELGVVDILKYFAVESKVKRPEILAPVSSWAMLRAAITAGADAVYFGVNKLNMRMTANNFSIEEISKVVAECHEKGVKAYLTLNVIVHEDEVSEVSDVLWAAKTAGVDAVICWDFSVIDMARMMDIEVHLSTQASVSNSKALQHYVDLGVSRVVLARECSLQQTVEMIDKNNVEIETFIHGAMCVAHSGRCFMSQFFNCKSANRGDCLQPCRRGYKVVDLETGADMEVSNNYVMSAKDMKTIDFIDKLIESGITCLKIEGRRRTPEYVMTVVSAYRRAVDAYFSDSLSDDLLVELNESLASVYNRDFSDGFYMGKPVNEFTDAYGSKATRSKQYVGYVKNYYPAVGVAEVQVESLQMSVGDNLLVLGNKTGVVEDVVASLQVDRVDLTVAQKGQSVGVKLKNKVRVNDKVYVFV